MFLNLSREIKVGPSPLSAGGKISGNTLPGLVTVFWKTLLNLHEGIQDIVWLGTVPNVEQLQALIDSHQQLLNYTINMRRIIDVN